MKIFVYLHYLLFGLLGAGFMYFAFNNTNWLQVVSVIKNGNKSIFIPVFLVSIVVYLSRVKRWQILFATLEIKAPFNYLLASLSLGYLVNLALPRFGEISRAAILKRSLNYQVNTTLSTIVFERAVDTLCLLLIIIFAFVLEYFSKNGLIHNFTNDSQFFTTNKLIIIVLVLLIAVIILVIIYKFDNKISRWIKEFIQTLFKLIRFKQKGKFYIHTLVIWLGFYLMTYLWFFMFDESQQLSAYQAFQIMVLGVIARTLPIQAGSAGAFHFIVSRALLLCGVSLVTSNALAIVIHGFQTILTLLLGFCAYIWLLFNKKYEAD